MAGSIIVLKLLLQRIKVPRTIILEETKKNTVFIGQVMGMGFCNQIGKINVYLLEFRSFNFLKSNTITFYFLGMLPGSNIHI